MLLPVILAGGSGTRLWPLSRQAYPKQFLALTDSSLSLLQATLERLKGIDSAPPWLICQEEHRFLAAEQLRQLSLQNASLLLEPEARGTAPAIALTALRACACGDDPLLLVLPADHLIKDETAFHSSLVAALPLAEAGKLVTFGIIPTEPHTGYGYIECGAPLSEGLESESFEVACFREKPDRALAERFICSGKHFWNSGMFLFRASRLVEELSHYHPEIVKHCREALAGESRDLDFIRVSQEAFSHCPDLSIDHALMEPLSQDTNKKAAAAVVPLDAGWSDIGAWSSLWDASEKDEAGNVTQGDVIALDSRNSYFYAQSRLLTTLGVEDLIVVETADAVLVAPKERVQDIRLLVSRMEADAREEISQHPQSYRPWGTSTVVHSSGNYRVKHLRVNPGEGLSLQKHRHRAEHWIVVRGTARVTRGKEVSLVTENQSTFIPVGEIHCLENPGKFPLELIEVQSGDLLDESDIERLKDRYGRE
ncbi:mannose-1-phosphate guanylyltransferase/mannose-6-phosphate isomerase [Marinobacterium lutimaris]|uniref:mannose-1-phosphate guanylyltransferase n=1 Tax=Marinobacterium lutimaris TaxID=568106 RepID=A0A1H6DND0_9GAMM|nr:mannose-1-phosphate guanylyltransferase/mannose-6-phosphate isomerase [Marinobacterium lutimaris]SEG86206.1 mannose-1-phosphate guanylyltransferase [Marinobacterium lutimaris]